MFLWILNAEKSLLVPILWLHAWFTAQGGNCLPLLLSGLYNLVLPGEGSARPTSLKEPGVLSRPGELMHQHHITVCWGFVPLFWVLLMIFSCYFSLILDSPLFQLEDHLSQTLTSSVGLNEDRSSAQKCINLESTLPHLFPCLYKPHLIYSQRHKHTYTLMKSHPPHFSAP